MLYTDSLYLLHPFPQAASNLSASLMGQLLVNKDAVHTSAPVNGNVTGICPWLKETPLSSSPHRASFIYLRQQVDRGGWH